MDPANESHKLARIEETMMRLSKGTSAKLKALMDSQLDTDKKLAETDERLKAVVNLVERLINHKRITREIRKRT